LTCPDLRISSLTVPTNGLTDGRVAVVWTVVNNGLTPAIGPWSDRILISTDNQLGGDTLLSTVNVAGPLDVGQSYTRTQQVLLPSSPGRFWIIASTDAGETVIEGSDRNNTLAHNLATDDCAFVSRLRANRGHPRCGRNSHPVRWTCNEHDRWHASAIQVGYRARSHGGHATHADRARQRERRF
jgi:hypothetical protein